MVVEFSLVHLAGLCISICVIYGWILVFGSGKTDVEAIDDMKRKADDHEYVRKDEKIIWRLKD